jgi:lipopolysaccharide transport system permease protein
MTRQGIIDLVWQLTKRDVIGRYKGSLLGIGWSFANPLLMLALYSFVFSGIFKTKWPGMQHGSDLMFAINLFTGLIVINMLAEVAGKSTTLVVANANYVKRVIFPLETLSVVTVLSAAFHALVSIILLLVFKIIATGSVSTSIVAIPFIWIPLVIFSLGLSLVLSALGVFVRDTSMIVNIGISLMLFLSPVFFPASAYPDQWKPVLSINPLVGMIEEMRTIAIQGKWPDLTVIIWPTLLSAAFTYVAWQLFRKARRAFADVL